VTSYTDTFNAGTINPGFVAYKLYNIVANTALSWPVDTNIGANIVAGFNECQTTAGLSFTMPPANQGSIGVACIFDNTGANQFTVLNNGGGVILTVAAGTAWVLVLSGNGTINGTWLTFQLGSGTSSAIAASLAGLGIKAITTTLNQEYPVTSYNTNQVIVAGSRAALAVWTGGGGSFSLTSAATLGANWFFNISNQGTGALVITDAGGALLNGAVSLTLNPQDSCILITDGVSWYTVGIGKNATFTFNFIAISLTGAGLTYTLTGGQLNQYSYRFTGVLSQNVMVIVPNTVQFYFFDNETTGAFTLSFGTAGQISPPVLTQGARGIYNCDSVNLLLSDTMGLSTPIPITGGGTGAITATGAQANLDVPSNLTAFSYAIMFG
jgi:hypothetical protein